MGDKRRFNLFAEAILKKFPSTQYKRIADIAGGRGHLQIALRKRGYESITTFDHRPRRAKGTKYVNRLFSSRTKGAFDLLVGMHPDEATDVIIDAAAKRNVPFIICPCCVKPSILPQETIAYRIWIHRLRMFAQKLGFSCEVIYLKMSGKNAVLIGRPR